MTTLHKPCQGDGPELYSNCPNPATQLVVPPPDWNKDDPAAFCDECAQVCLDNGGTIYTPPTTD